MAQQAALNLSHFRLLWLVYNRPEGITGADLVAEMKRRGWCEPDLKPADLGLAPRDLVRRPLMAANQA